MIRTFLSKLHRGLGRAIDVLGLAEDAPPRRPPYERWVRSDEAGRPITVNVASGFVGSDKEAAERLNETWRRAAAAREERFARPVRRDETLDDRTATAVAMAAEAAQKERAAARLNETWRLLQLEKEHQRLRRELEVVRGHMERFRSERDRALGEMAAVRKNLGTVTVSELRDEVLRLTAVADEERTARQQRERDAWTCREEIVRVREALAEVRKERDRVLGRLNELEQHPGHIEAERDAHAREAKRFCDENTELRGQLVRCTKERDEARAAHAAAHLRLSRLAADRVNGEGG